MLKINNLNLFLLLTFTIIYGETIFETNFSDSTLNGWLDISALQSYRGTNKGLFATFKRQDSPSGYALGIPDSLQGFYSNATVSERGSVCVDYLFEREIDRRNAKIEIEFGMRVEKVNLSEHNRFLCILLDGVQRKPDLTLVNKRILGPYQSTTGNEYGERIPYHLRIRPDYYIALEYGQKIEKTIDNEYIPGFISPYSAKPDANGSFHNWSNPNALKKIRDAEPTMNLEKKFVIFTWVIEPTWQYLLEDGVIVKPKQNTQGDPPMDGRCYVGPVNLMPDSIKNYYPNYEYFPTFNGIRFFMMNLKPEAGCWISHVKITKNDFTASNPFLAKKQQKTEARFTQQTLLNGKSNKHSNPKNINKKRLKVFSF